MDRKRERERETKAATRFREITVYYLFKIYRIASRKMSWEL